MNFSWVRPFLIKGKQQLIKNAPHILMGFGTAGTITSLIFAVKNTPAAHEEHIQMMTDETLKVHQEMTREEVEIMVRNKKIKPSRIPTMDLLKWVGKYYGPAAIMELFALICFWGAHGIDIRRQAVIASLYSSAEHLIAEYQKKVTELIGEKGAKEVNNAIAQDHMDKIQRPKETYILDGGVERWFIIDDQHFKSSWQKIKDAQNDANHEMIQNMYLSKADLYWLLDPERKYLKPDCESGMVGWTVDKLIELDIDWASDPNHEPIGIVKVRDKDGFPYLPKPGFSTLC